MDKLIEVSFEFVCLVKGFIIIIKNYVSQMLEAFSHLIPRSRKSVRH